MCTCNILRLIFKNQSIKQHLVRAKLEVNNNILILGLC